MTCTESRGRAAAQVKSPSAGIVELIWTREGKRAPYVDTDGAHNEYTASINGVACSNDELPDVIRLDAADSGPCQDAIVPGGADRSVTMTVVGTVISRGRWMCGAPAAGPTTGIAPTGT